MKKLLGKKQLDKKNNMSWQSKITDGIKEIVEHIGRFTSRNGHAQQAVPAQHRLLTMIGMYLGWKGGDEIRDAAFAKNKTAEGDYEESKKEDVPLLLRPIHGIIKWNQHSDSSDNKWKNVAYHITPAVTSAIGTLAGSKLLFQLNGRAAGFNETISRMKKGEGVSTLNMDNLVQSRQGAVSGAAAAATAGFGASSLAQAVFSASINDRFRAYSGGKINLGNAVGGNFSPARALDERLEKVGFYVKSALDSGEKIDKRWASICVKQVFKPVFSKIIETPHEEEKAIDIVHQTLQSTFDKHHQAGLRGEDLINAVSKEIKEIMGNANPILNDNEKFEFRGFDQFYREQLKYKASDLTLGNASPTMRKITETIADKTPIGKKYSAKITEEYIRQQELKAANSVGGRS